MPSVTRRTDRRAITMGAFTDRGLGGGMGVGGVCEEGRVVSFVELPARESTGRCSSARHLSQPVQACRVLLHV